MLYLTGLNVKNVFLISVSIQIRKILKDIGYTLCTINRSLFGIYKGIINFLWFYCNFYTLEECHDSS